MIYIFVTSWLTYTHTIFAVLQQRILHVTLYATTECPVLFLHPVDLRDLDGDSSVLPTKQLIARNLECSN